MIQNEGVRGYQLIAVTDKKRSDVSTVTTFQLWHRGPLEKRETQVERQSGRLEKSLQKLELVKTEGNVKVMVRDTRRLGEWFCSFFELKPHLRRIRVMEVEGSLSPSLCLGSLECVGVGVCGYLRTPAGSPPQCESSPPLFVDDVLQPWTMVKLVLLQIVADVFVDVGHILGATVDTMLDTE